MSEQKTTIAEIISNATDEGSWINATFEAVVRNATAGQGRKPSKADLHHPKNPAIKVKAALFGASFLDLNGSLVKFGDKGTKAKRYNGEVEVTMSDKTSIMVVGDAPAPDASNTPPARNDQRGDPTPTPGNKQTPPAQQGDPVAEFHKAFKKISLCYMHAFQYATDINNRLGGKLTPDQFQACIASVFITAKDNGALRAPPALREADGAGFKTYVAVKPVVDEAAQAEERRKAAEAAAAEAARVAREKAEREHAENLDEDVPF